MTPEQIGAAIRAFRTEKCPACGGKKEVPKDAFCIECLGFLSDDLRELISDPSKFIVTYHPAIAYINKHRKGRPHLPAGVPKMSSESH